ncbi:mitogen-activated protein kinase kinase kinase 3-like isoform X2 [Clytia hemisphaerica]|uniref:mitogen-activated protein kinase kinase kinase 3-like isoform X2 n=1 Tax=Clytia hemisphaerica TaxID=252671 RepID=UPI0034D4FB2F
MDELEFQCGYTALHWASIYGKVEIAHALLNDSSCKIDTRDSGGYTALHLSIKHGHYDVLQLLLNYGANLNLKTRGGRMPEDLAMNYDLWDAINVLQKARKNKELQQREKPQKWKLGKLLGVGAFGQVYLGYDEESGKELAIKCVKTMGQRLSVIEKQVQELDNEIGVLRNLSHKNILRYYGFEKVKPSSMYIFMEYMPGGSMYALLQEKGGLNEDHLRMYTAQILEGVAYLHKNLVIHRDIKGANILLDSSLQNVRLADFGLSKKIERCSLMSDLQAVFGSPFWMAPEVVRATPNGNSYGRKADVWSIGCTIVEMLTTKPPFSQFEPMTAIYNIGAGRILPHIPQDVSENLHDMMQQCFKRDPRLRPSAQDLLNHPFIKKDRIASSANGGLVEHDEPCQGIRDSENNYMISQLIETSSEETLLSPVDSITDDSDIETSTMSTHSFPTSFSSQQNNKTSLVTNNLTMYSLTTEDFVNLEVDDVKELHCPTTSAKGKVSAVSKLFNLLLKSKQKTQQLLKLMLL